MILVTTVIILTQGIVKNNLLRETQKRGLYEKISFYLVCYFIMDEYESNNNSKRTRI